MRSRSRSLSSASSLAGAPSPWAAESFVALAQSWASAVCSIESLTPELLESSCPGSDKHSKEEDELFWSWVHQGYNAKARGPSETRDACTLRQQWDVIRPSVAQFHAILTELWSDDPVTTLDSLPARELQQLLERAVDAFEERTGQGFHHLDVWNLLAHHEDWNRVLKPLVLREKVGNSAAVAATAAVAVGGRHEDAVAPNCREMEEVNSASTGRSFGAVPVSVRKQRVTGAKRRKKAPQRVHQEVDSAEEVEANGGDPQVRYQVINNVETEDLGCGDEVHQAGGSVDEVREAAVVTPTHSDKTQRAISKRAAKRSRVMQTARAVEVRRRGQDAQDGPGIEAPTAEQQPLEAPQTVAIAEGLATDMSNQDEEPETRVEAVHLALAWADVSCSVADISPRLEESNKWFWFLVSSIYFDLVAKPDCRGDIEGVLKDQWLEIKECVAAFHLLYEAELAKKTDVRRADREVVILRAQEEFWTQYEHWFQHRAAWEALERHAEWESVLRPLILSSSAPRASSGASSLEQKDRCDKATRETSAELNAVSIVSDDCGTVTDKIAPATCREAPDPPSFKSLIAMATSEKSSALSAQWLEWITHHSDLQVMTQSEAGLSREAVEYLHLRRQQILQKTRESK